MIKTPVKYDEEWFGVLDADGKLLFQMKWGRNDQTHDVDVTGFHIAKCINEAEGLRAEVERLERNMATATHALSRVKNRAKRADVDNVIWWVRDALDTIDRRNASYEVAAAALEGNAVAKEMSQSPWIPVGERLPPKVEEGEQTPQYLVTYEYANNGHPYRRSECVWWTWQGTWLMYFLGQLKNFETDERKVIAWMPLPQPCKPSETQEGE